MNKKIFILLLAFLLLFVAACGQQQAEKEEPAPEPKQEEKQEEKQPEPVEVAELSYVGSDTCAKCHGDVHSSWSKTLHSKMVQDAEANPDVLIGDFTKEGEPLSMASVAKEDIKYTIGSKWKQRYVIEKDNDLRILPMQWINATQEWTPYKKDNWEQRNYEDLCISCHATGYQPETESFEMGITCEACHGPGSEHVKGGEIINLADLTSEQQTDVCAQCHVRGKNVDGSREDALGFKPGDKLSDFYNAGTPETKPDWFHENGDSKKHHQQYNDFIQSTHYTEANMSCLSCHAPHDNGIEGQLKMAGDELCASCHGDGKYTVEQNMPKRAKSATPGDITTHTFRAKYDL